MKKLLFTALLALSLPLLSEEDNQVDQLVQSVSANEMTLSIIKPDAVSDHHIGDIIARFEKAGLHVAAIKMVRLTEEEAGKFYAVHKDKPFYKDLTVYMSSGPIVPIVLEGSSAISMNRKLMGATDPLQADAGTIRKDFAKSKSINAVHGSDSKDSAKEEITFFFKPAEIFSK